jgi:endonuclease/exonuclease/phosphatase family metal-dependent hydrolase
MLLLTWNIQWGLGVDGRVDLARIIDTARGIADFDVLCLQEVSRNYPGLAGNDGGDQFARLAELLPGYHAIEGVALDRYTPDQGRQQFGNMILSRHAPLQVLRHQLPWPAARIKAGAQMPSMPRLALEATLDLPSGALRVTTTHLEFYSGTQRAAQVEALRAIQADAASHAADPAQPGKLGGPFETRSRNGRAILTGDFNCTPDDAVIGRLQEPMPESVPAYVDAWPLMHPTGPRVPTAGVYDKVQWQNNEWCVDYIFVTEDIRARVRRIEVDTQTAASDHQPVLLEIEI